MSKRMTETQIVSILKEAEAGISAKVTPAVNPVYINLGDFDYAA
ncbi:hypothetical protein [Psychrobacter celer]